MSPYPIRSLFLAAILLNGPTSPAAESTPPPPGRQLTPHGWRGGARQARFGLFIHWGPVSLKGTEIGWSRGGERAAG